MEQWDVVIVGAGPAGSTLARLLPKNLKIALIDGAAAHPEKNGKLCGGLLAPDAQKMLARYALSLPKDILVDPQIFSVRVTDTRTGLVRYYPRAYVNVDRARFDRWLVGLIPSSVQRFAATVLNIERGDEGYTVTLSESGETRDLFAHLVVGADGANSIVRKFIAPQRKIRTYVAIQQTFSAETMSVRPSYACIFDPPSSRCCSWTIFKDGTLLYGGAFSPHGCRTAFEEQKRNLGAFGFSFPDPERTDACLVRRPRHVREVCVSDKSGSAFLIGEAAGWISPSSLEGISWAMQSAEILANVLSLTATPSRALRRRVWRAYFPMRVRLLCKILKCPAMYVPFLRHLVMLSGITCMKVLPSTSK